MAYSCSSAKYFKNVVNKMIIFIIYYLTGEICSYAHTSTYQALQEILVRYFLAYKVITSQNLKTSSLVLWNRLFQDVHSDGTELAFNL